MKPEPSKLIFILLFLPILVSLHVKALDKCSEIFRHEQMSIEDLHIKHVNSAEVFVSLNDPRALGESDACGPACAVNLVQVFRNFLGIGPHTDPYRIFKNLYIEDPSLKDPLNANPSKMQEVLEKLFTEFTSGENVKIKTIALDDFDQARSNWKNLELVNSITKDSITPKSNELKVLGYLRVIDGMIAGAHYVLIKGVNENRLQLIEPNHPEMFQGFKFAEIPVNGEMTSIELIPTITNVERAGFESGARFIAYTISTVTYDK